MIQTIRGIRGIRGIQTCDYRHLYPVAYDMFIAGRVRRRASRRVMQRTCVSFLVFPIHGVPF